MKPRMKFYSDGSRVIIGNEIIKYELLTYVLQLKKLEYKSPLAQATNKLIELMKIQNQRRAGKL